MKFQFTVWSIFVSVPLQLVCGEAALSIDTEIVAALLPGFHETVLHDGAVFKPRKKAAASDEILFVRPEIKNLMAAVKKKE